MSTSPRSRTRSRVLTLFPVLVLVAGLTLAGTTPAFAATIIVNCAPGPTISDSPSRLPLPAIPW